MDQHLPSSTVTLAATKSVQDGYHNSQWRYTYSLFYGYWRISCRHSQEREGLLQQIVTGDKHDLIIISQTLIKRVWSGNTPHVRTETEIPTSGLCRQSDAALVWVCNGPLLVQYFEHGTTDASYTIILKLKLKLAICNKHRGLLSEVVLLVNDNAYLHSAAAITESIRQMRSELLPHPHTVHTQFNLVITCLDPKEALHQKRFSSNAEVKDAGHMLLQS